MSELIVRELRLRGYDGLKQGATPPLPGWAGKLSDVEVRVREHRHVDRLAVRYSRRRARQPGLEL